MMTKERQCRDCLYGSFQSAEVAGSWTWKGVCTATKRPHYVEQNWSCSCGKFVGRPRITRTNNETEVGCDK